MDEVRLFLMESGRVALARLCARLIPFPLVRRPVLDTGLGYSSALPLATTGHGEGRLVFITANRYRGGVYVGVSAEIGVAIARE